MVQIVFEIVGIFSARKQYENGLRKTKSIKIAVLLLALILTVGLENSLVLWNFTECRF